ncbi:MAG: hypothetical protein AAF773_11900 [Cyanobacteria bacterium P01_D01_bin.115]
MNNDSRQPTRRSRSSSDEEARAYLDQLATEHDASLRDIKAAKRRMIVFRFLYVAAVLIIIWDARFTYQSFNTYMENQNLAFGIAVLIGAVQISVNACVFTGNAKKVFQIDFDRNGKVDWYDYIGVFLLSFSALSLYIVNIGTNLLGTNMYGGMEMGVAIAQAFTIPLEQNLPFVAGFLNPVITLLGSLFPLACATFLCLGDELIIILADRLIALTRKSIPELRKAEAILKRRMEKARGFETALAKGGYDQGWKEGANATQW